MEMQRNSLFQLNENTVKKIRYIKLDKKASFSDEDIEFLSVDKERYKSIDFYSFGFYDLLRCIMPKNINHKEHFLITYPCERAANALKTEQWFGIFPLAQEKIFTNLQNQENIIDPFFCDKTVQEQLPFMGIILISLSKHTEDFNDLLTNYVNLIENNFIDFSSKKLEGSFYVSEVYYSLNCSDLCLVIRTDSLPFIHTVNRNLEEIAKENCYDINTTVVFSIQNNTSLDFLKTLSQKNSAVSFIVRSNKMLSDPFISYGVNGIGKYVTKLPFDEYIKYLPDIFSYKLNGEDIDSSSFARSICHEREWFKEDNDYQILKIKDDNEDKQHEIIKSKADKEKFHQLISIYTKKVAELFKEISEKADGLFTYSNYTLTYKEAFFNEFRLMRDLFLTYSDLWYQSASESGVVFFAQLWIALSGLKEMINECDKYHKENDIISLEESIYVLLNTNHEIVCDLNGYNKQFQFLNQDSVNFPVYEIQSKVNSQKYMAAYCSFLHRLFTTYYKTTNKDEQLVQKFPMALVDINQRKIIAKIFFPYSYTDNTKEKNKCNRTLFSVHFPSSEYFSNVWTSIPLLMHEISHAQHFGKAKDRNKALIISIDRFFSSFIVQRMVKAVNDGVVINTSSILIEKLEDIVYQSIVDFRKDIIEGSIDEMTFSDVVKNCKEFYNGIFDKKEKTKTITYSGLSILSKTIKNDVEFILQKVGFTNICYIFNPGVDYPKSLFYFFNELFLEYNNEFYEQNKEIYDSKFINEILFQIKYLQQNCKCDNEEDPDLILLTLTQYRYKKYVKKDHSEVYDGNFIDAIYIAFQIILLAGMKSIFLKYNDRFIKNISKKIFFRNLVPELNTETLDLFNQRLNRAYKKFIIKNKNNHDKGYSESDLSHDTYLLESMLSEYYELYISINNVVKYMMSDNEYPYYKDFIGTEEFIKILHSKCSSYIKQTEKNENVFKTIFTRSNRSQLIKMGFFEDNTDILNKIFITVISECHDNYVNNEIDDRVMMFMEIYADCGMCTAIGFDPFGYCMFTTSVHNLVNEQEIVNLNASFFADRIGSILRAYLDNRPDLVRNFINKLMDIEMLSSICVFLKEIRCSDSVNHTFLEIQSKIETMSYIQKLIIYRNSNYILKKAQDITEDLRWWAYDIVGTLIDAIEKEYNITYDIIVQNKISLAKSYLLNLHCLIKVILNEDILAHIVIDDYEGYFSSLQNLMKKSKVFDNAYEDECVKEIREFYNLDFCNNHSNKFENYYTIYSNGFINQSNFIFNRYCDYRNSYYHLVQELLELPNNDDNNHDIGCWFNIIDQYYMN